MGFEPSLSVEAGNELGWDTPSLMLADPGRYAVQLERTRSWESDHACWSGLPNFKQYGPELPPPCCVAMTQVYPTDGSARDDFRAILSNVLVCPLSPADVSSLLALWAEWILNEDPDREPLIVEFAHGAFGSLSERHRPVFHEFVTPNFVIGAFTQNSRSQEKSRVVRFVSEILTLLKSSNADQALEESQRTLVNVIKIHLYACLRAHGVHLGVAQSIALVYKTHPCVLPNPSEWTKFSNLVITLLAGYQIQHVGQDWEVFEQATEDVSLMLPLIWGRSSSVDGILDSLRVFYTIMSSEGKDYLSSPGCGLLSIIDKIPTFFQEKAVQDMVEQSSQPSGEARAVIVLETMIKWLTMRKAKAGISPWIMSILRELQRRDRNSILIEIAYSCTETLALALPQPKFTSAVEDIFFFFLLGFQHSESVFHAVVANVPHILTRLSALKWDERLQRLGEAVYFLMGRFPNFPDLYDPIQRTIGNIEDSHLLIENPSEARVRELRSLAWLSPIHSTTFIHSDTKISSYLVEDALSLRSETGMVGLINLGNTCYMNSVLQALYITKNFCDDILSAPLSPSQVVLFRLQQVFAYLRYSQRSIYSPGEFLKAARPPWFESGRQQDCSEFLRYLIDTLDEQEKVSLSSKFNRVQPVCSLPPSTSVKALTKTATAESNARLEDEDIPRITSRSSNMALDVISELPENGHQDEEMLSQCSDVRMDEDFLGSRGSLSVPTRDGSDEEADFRGSRTSLGSFSMKHWTTEENLSTSSNAGSREGHLDILDGPLSNYHSDSADSGIQSVGDSIGGSRDSMGDGKDPKERSGFPPSSHEEPISKVKPTTTTTTPPHELDANSRSTTKDECDSLASLVQKHLGGKLRTRYQCSQCLSISEHRETFTELHLAIPESKKTDLGMQHLVDGYLSPETLEGDNQYHCDNCQGLQDAEKSVHLLEAPQHLLCTLLRFKYERELNRKSKVFTDVEYTLDLELPIHHSEEGQTLVRTEKFALYAIVIHSGYSSDGGHYYTYARPPPRDMTELNCDTWYIFNDSKVSFGNFQSFKDVVRQFPRDVAYQLMYIKMESQDRAQVSRPRARRPLRADLKSAVDKDNLKFLREKERISARNQTPSSARGLYNKWENSKKDEDEGGGGSGGSHGPSLMAIITAKNMSDYVRITPDLHLVGLSSMNELAVRAMAIETWKAFHSSDGTIGGRNPIGQIVFPSTTALG
eukprot:maker-scaffold187_size272365-snap-gene-1.28 protein:Tk10320 transcript:maker-scaffold187_size272365-snap-gene-1.28-mRNA-1 annotation:"ubiquitin carboxyl-terminal hydrolase 38-like"